MNTFHFYSFKILPCICLVASCCLSQQWPYPYVQNKKIIEFGWDMPNARFVAENIEEMEQRPFDGLIFFPDHVNRIPFNFDIEAWPEDRFDSTLLKGIAWDRFTDNFLMTWSGDDFGMDYFNDAHWENILHNMKMLARAARWARCAGIVFDTEFYSQRSPWSFEDHANGRTEEELAAVMRLCGGQVMAAWQSEFPDLKVLCMFILTYLPERWRMLPHFVNGMLDSIGPGTLLIEGNEGTYYVEDGDLFFKADNWRGKNFSYEWIKDTSYFDCLIQHIAPENHEKYIRQVQVARALYSDEVYGVYPNGSPPPEDLPEYPLRWEHNVYISLLSTDEYVWGYFENMAWWDNPDDRPIGQSIAQAVPWPGVEQGIISARQKFESGDPLGWNIRNEQPDSTIKIAITSPQSGSNMETGPMTISAEASGADIAQVDFYVNSIRIGSAKNEPFELSYVELQDGDYMLAAIAYTFNPDGNPGNGMLGVSAPVRITVGQTEVKKHPGPVVGLHNLSIKAGPDGLIFHMPVEGTHTISIFDLQGKQATSVITEKSGWYRISELPSGVHLVQIDTGNNAITCPFFIANERSRK